MATRVPPDIDEDEEDTPPPSQEAVAYRALALVGLLGRTQAEMECQRDPASREKWAGIWKKIVAWFAEEGVKPHQSAQERKLLAKPFGKWSQGEVFETIWRTEALAALLWALGKLPEMPSYETMVHSKAVFAVIPLLVPTAEFKQTVKLRPDEEIESARQAAEFWHWRARTEQLRQRGFVPPSGDTFEACIERGVKAAKRDKIVPRIKQGDVSILGKPYSQLTQEEYANAHSVAVERHYALNWLCGDSDEGDWDSVRTDT
jgi:hypothetical protein